VSLVPAARESLLERPRALPPPLRAAARRSRPTSLRARGALQWLATRPNLPVAAGVLAIASIALLAVAVPGATIGFDFEKSYNEGWNAYQAARAAAGEALYNGDPARLVNYPFLSFYIVAWLKPLFGNVLLIGRGLNAASFAMSGGLSALVVRRLGGGSIEMLFGAACTLGFQSIQAQAWIAVDEPQMLAEALMLGGLLCYVSGRPTFCRLVGSALLFAAGGFVKQILIAIPFAVTLDVLGKDRRLFVIWCLCGALAIMLFSALSSLIAGGDFWSEIFTPRIYHWSRLTYHGRKLLIAFKWPLIASLVYWLRCRPLRYAALMRGYGAAALLSGLVLSGADGVASNVYLDFAVFMGMTSGLALGRWRRALSGRASGALAAAALPALLALPVLTRLLPGLHPLFNFDATLQDYRYQEADFQQAKAFLRAQTGAVLCENLLLCLESGKPLLVDPFNLRGEILVGRVSQAAMTGEVARLRFRVIELPTDVYQRARPGQLTPYLLEQARFTEDTLKAIAAYYTPRFRTDHAIFFFPRPHPSQEQASAHTVAPAPRD
jgi:hypothetical protein